LLEEVAVARRYRVAWAPTIYPGIPVFIDTPVEAKPASRDICFSCPEDRDYSKLDPFFEAGVRTMHIRFDDTIHISTHPEDALTYGTGDEAFCRGVRDLLNAVHRH
jgi:hypothetical protein